MNAKFFLKRLCHGVMRAWPCLLPVAALTGLPAVADDPFERVEHGCVHIDVRGRGSGTGFFVHTNGYVLSNYHVIQGGRQVQIRTRDGKTHPVTHVLNYSARADLVLLKTEYKPSVVLEIGLPEETKVDMDVFVIGSPKGLSWARSQGKIEGIVYEGFEQLQHSAKTDSGNSGSPIFDKSGRVHGINTWLVIRQVRAADGGYRLDWLNPRSRGVSSRVIATFLAQPHRPTHFATLASSYEAAEKANMILWACQIADRTMRQMHGSIREMGTLTQVKTDPTRKTVSGRPVITSRRTYFTNTQEFVREASNHAILLKFFDAQIGTKGHDARIQYTLDFWNQSQQHLRTAIDTISKAHGTNPPTVSRAYGKARDEFTQANDTFYRTLVQAVRVYNSNVPAYGGNPYYDAATINEMIKFYRERGLRL